MKLLLAMFAVVSALTFANVQPAHATTRTASVSVCGGGYCQVTYTTYTLQNGQWVATSSWTVTYPDERDSYPAVEY